MLVHLRIPVIVVAAPTFRSFVTAIESLTVKSPVIVAAALTFKFPVVVATLTIYAVLASPVNALPSPLNELATKVPATVAAPDILTSTKLPIPIVPIPLTSI